MFLNPTGRRWRRVRIAALVLLAALIAVIAVAVPKLTASPALAGAGVPEAPTLDEIGDPPVVGEGPLVRVVRLLESGGRTYAQEPFYGQVVGELSAADATKARDAEYAVQRYGYSATAEKTISLTFDDGPHPVHTPQLLDLLSEHGVPATFFVIGDEAARHPEIVQRLSLEGHAVANHTLTHVDMNETPSFRQRAELALTDRLLRAETGNYASYFRLPYEGADEKSIRKDLTGILRAQQLGYAVASHDFDPQDWSFPVGTDVDEVPMPPLDEQSNITVLLHDGGADRTLTLEYVEKLIVEARAAGYTFHSMPQVMPAIQAATGTAPVSAWDTAALGLATVLFVWPGSVLTVLFVLALVTMLGLGLLTTVLAVVRSRRRRKAPNVAAPAGVSVLIAAYNEELVITRTLQYVLASEYPVDEVLVVDDGSTDGTAAMVRDVAELDSRVRLLQQPNSGKWAALNRGFEEARHPVVVTLDADTLFAPTTVGHLVAGFTRPDVGAVAGVIKVGNYARNVVTRWQALEYITQIGVDRSASALLNAVMIVPGACAAWRREAVLEAGGYSNATLAEDCDLTLLLHQHGWRVEQADQAVAFTEAPETVDDLLKQRVRWMFGTVQALWRHRDMILRPRFGWLGMLIMPMAALQILLPLVFTPLVVVVVLQMLASAGPLPVLGYFLLFAVIYGAIAAVAVRLLEERPAHLLMVPLYRFIYEPLRAYLLYATIGTAVRGIRLGWNKLARTAHMDEAAEQPVTVPA
ncbi:biofilm PGA synthesis N-glycosyltransferase PgaC [Blastococcus colisei]|uniref:Biofilm PGA synthesis N-glycosyltransferase PgaC n=1 Tax=Blastococcus colisei TaxID=1564162 RepID=A0A543P1C2_9ACTN|nr:biofilm PGA synthesis N-glycosyltransferase PgaC [Blastococcus colisei]